MEPSSGWDSFQAGARSYPESLGAPTDWPADVKFRGLPPGLVQERHEPRRGQRCRRGRAAGPAGSGLAWAEPHRSDRLQKDASHKGAHQRWKSFRDHALKAMRANFGKCRRRAAARLLKVPKGRIPADADLVVTLSHKQGIGLYLSDEKRLGRELSGAALPARIEQGGGHRRAV